MFPGFQVLYGEEDEILMAESEDPIIQQIWTRLIVSFKNYFWMLW